MNYNADKLYILVVDDIPLQLKSAVQMLKIVIKDACNTQNITENNNNNNNAQIIKDNSNNIVIVTATNCSDAIRKSRENKIDIVFMDNDLKSSVADNIEAECNLSNNCNTDGFTEIEEQDYLERNNGCNASNAIRQILPDVIIYSMSSNHPESGTTNAFETCFKENCSGNESIGKLALSINKNIKTILTQIIADSLQKKTPEYMSFSSSLGLDSPKSISLENQTVNLPIKKKPSPILVNNSNSNLYRVAPTNSVIGGIKRTRKPRKKQRKTKKRSSQRRKTNKRK